MRGMWGTTAVHPPSKNTCTPYPTGRLRPGTPASPGQHRLGLVRHFLSTPRAGSSWVAAGKALIDVGEQESHNSKDSRQCRLAPLPAYDAYRTGVQMVGRSMAVTFRWDKGY